MQNRVLNSFAYSSSASFFQVIAAGRSGEKWHSAEGADSSSMMVSALLSAGGILIFAAVERQRRWGKEGNIEENGTGLEEKCKN